MTVSLAGIVAELQRDVGVAALCRPRRGVEKESLRIDRHGMLALTPHPQALGSPLTHPQITTDFCEAQLEFVTGVHDTVAGLLEELQQIHQFTYAVLGSELLWPASMPCMLSGASQVPEARFGSSSIGRLKHLYRLGLALRYGRVMQTISGVHFNFSLPDPFWVWLRDELGSKLSLRDFRTEQYFGLIRNFKRTSWLLLYLLGASPALCKTFLDGRGHHLDVLDEGTLALPYATSLRMGRLGYQSDAQASLRLSCNSLRSYALSLGDALTRPHPPYQKLGIRSNGDYLQLHDSLLQIENELYGDIRPKQPIHPGERPLNALLDRGIEYVEIRCLDVNPRLPMGLDAETVRFLDVFLLHCLLTESPPDIPEEIQMQASNRLLTVDRGRKPGLLLQTLAGERPLRVLGEAILDACMPFVTILDAVDGGDAYARAFSIQRRRLEDPGETPSAQLLFVLQEQQIPFFRLGMNQAHHHARLFANVQLSARTLAEMQEESRRSHERQAELEATEEAHFEAFRRSYVHQAREALATAARI